MACQRGRLTQVLLSFQFSKLSNYFKIFRLSSSCEFSPTIGTIIYNTWKKDCWDKEDLGDMERDFIKSFRAQLINTLYPTTLSSVTFRWLISTQNNNVSLKKQKCFGKEHLHLVQINTSKKWLVPDLCGLSFSLTNCPRSLKIVFMNFKRNV